MHAVAKYTHQQYPISASELDNLLNQMVKLLDGSNQTIRRSVFSPGGQWECLGISRDTM